jgi:hypothetical protein
METIARHLLRSGDAVIYFGETCPFGQMDTVFSALRRVKKISKAELYKDP